MLQKLPEHLLEQLVVPELRLPEYRKYWFRRLWLRKYWKWWKLRLRKQRKRREQRWLRLRKQWERWKQRLRKYRKHWELRLHWQRRMLDGGVLQRPVVDHPVPGRKIRVPDGITETKRRAGGCASPCLLHIGQEPGRKTAGEKEEGLYEQKENGTDGWHRASYGGRGGAGNGPGGYGICDGRENPQTAQFWEQYPGGRRSSGNRTTEPGAG